MAHPIRPESYQEINNFYSTTVYEKGAEVVRMLQTMMGRDGFAEGITEYFKRYDGQAVTCDDFIDAMQAAFVRRDPNADLTQFRNWYSQAGTPRLKVRGAFDAAKRTYSLEIAQHTPKVGVEKLSDLIKPPLHVPVRVGLLDQDGAEMSLVLAGEKSASASRSRVLSLTEHKQTFVFENIASHPVPSLLRDFSAPVIIDYPYSDVELALLSAKDSDPFNRWEALQRLAVRVISGRVREALEPAAEDRLAESFAATLADTRLDSMLRSLALTLPVEYVIGEELPVYDPRAVHTARNATASMLGERLKTDWMESYETHRPNAPYVFSARHNARRALANLSLSYIAAADANLADDLAWRQFTKADNMTDRQGALQILVYHHLPHAQAALDRFYARHRKSGSAMDKWLSVQAMASGGDLRVLARVKQLLGHPAFNYRNPNKVRSLLGSFFSGNPSSFHQSAVYPFWAEQVAKVDHINPSAAGRLARAMDRWQRLPKPLHAAAKAALEQLARTAGLSTDVSEIVGKALRV